MVLAKAHSMELPLLQYAGPVAGLNRRYLGERLIPLRHEIGSVDGAAHRFERDFLPADRRASWPRCVRGQQLPPIEVHDGGPEWGSSPSNSGEFQ